MEGSKMVKETLHLLLSTPDYLEIEDEVEETKSPEMVLLGYR